MSYLIDCACLETFLGVDSSVAVSTRQLFSPVIVVEDDEAAVSTSESNLVALVVPPVGVRLSVHHITESNHVPKKQTMKSQCMIFTSVRP